MEDSGGSRRGAYWPPLLKKGLLDWITRLAQAFIPDGISFETVGSTGSIARFRMD